LLQGRCQPSALPLSPLGERAGEEEIRGMGKKPASIVIFKKMWY